MAAWEYDNFDLLIETEGDEGEYRARVIEAPTGESPTGTFRIPFEPTQLENLMLKLDPGRSGTRRVAADPQSQAALDLGSGLFEAVFSSDIRLAWARSNDSGPSRATRPETPVAAGRGAGDRGAALGAAPRPSPEQLHRPVRTHPRRPLPRGRRQPHVPSTSTGPCAFWSSSPRRPTCPSSTPRPSGTASMPLWPTGSRRGRCSSTDSNSRRCKAFDVDPPPRRPRPALRRPRRVRPPGPGRRPLLCDRYGRPAKVSSGVLGPYLRDHDPLRLIVLNACQSARMDSKEPVHAMAQALVQQDCVALVSMQFPISEDAAAAFTGEFYGALADGLAVDQSVSSGRKALLASYASEWATPVLFLRDPEGKVFDHIVPLSEDLSSGADEAAATALAATAAVAGAAGVMAAAARRRDLRRRGSSRCGDPRCGDPRCGDPR